MDFADKFHCASSMGFQTSFWNAVKRSSPLSHAVPMPVPGVLEMPHKFNKTGVMSFTLGSSRRYCCLIYLSLEW